MFIVQKTDYKMHENTYVDIKKTILQRIFTYNNSRTISIIIIKADTQLAFRHTYHSGTLSIPEQLAFGHLAYPRVGTSSMPTHLACRGVGTSSMPTHLAFRHI